MGKSQWQIDIYEKSNNKRRPLDDFLNGLSKQDIAFIQKGIKRLEEYGNVIADGHYAKFLRDNIYELRVRTNHGHYRIFCFFFDGTKIVITHGYSKKTGPVDSNQIDKAIEYRKDYYAHHKE